MFGLVLKRDYDGMLRQYLDSAETTRVTMLRLIDAERDLARESTLRERLELDKAAIDSEYRRLVETLGTLAKRPSLDTFTSTDLFAEDTKQETVWVSDPEMSSDAIFAKISLEDSGKDDG